MDTEKKSEVPISHGISRVEKDAEKDSEIERSHRTHRSQLTDNTPTENFSMPIVSVEDFFKADLPLPDHSLEQSPCYPVIGSKPEGKYIMYHCKMHPNFKNTNLESIEHHCRFADPDHHKAELLKSQGAGLS